MTAISVKTLSQCVFDTFWTQKYHHSNGTKISHRGIYKRFEIIILGIDLEVRVYRSQCKRKKPHVKVVTIADEKINTVHGPQSKI